MGTPYAALALLGEANEKRKLYSKSWSKDDVQVISDIVMVLMQKVANFVKTAYIWVGHLPQFNITSV